MCASAVEDAKHNAKLNGIHLDPELEPLPLPLDDNYTQATAPRFQFICAKVEEALSRLLVYLQQSQIDLSQYEVVAILDPPRAGTHKSVSKAIRECPFIQRVIYVSCSPKSAMQNWLELTRPENSEKRFRGRPFELQRALPFDMFPQTELCELLLEFTR
jgi:tRNA (uracil-5-)-methyltransferase